MMTKTGGRKGRKLADGSYVYENSIKEEIIVYKELASTFQEEMRGDYYYYSIDFDDDRRTTGEPILQTLSKYNWKINKNGYIREIGMDIGFTDTCLNPASAIVVLNNYYRKYGYPKEK